MVAFTERRIMQVVRCTNAVRASHVWLAGELVWTTDLGELWVGDGATAGGVCPRLGRERWIALTTTGGTTISGGTGTTLPWETTIRDDTDAFSRAGGEITCLRAGWLDIAADLSASNTATDTTGRVRLAVQRDPGTGTFANIAGGFAFARVQNVGGTGFEVSCSVRTLLQVAANDKIRCRAVQATGGTLVTVASGCRLTMRYIQ